MPAKRTPLNRAARMRITPEAVELFGQLIEAETKDDWWSLHNRLHDLLQTPPWQWPCILGPDDELHGGFGEPAARALFDELVRRLDEAPATTKGSR
jgi:hypothetical protein